jgi:hypothetical protein
MLEDLCKECNYTREQHIPCSCDIKYPHSRQAFACSLFKETYEEVALDAGSSRW